MKETPSYNIAALTDLLDDHSVVHRHVYNYFAPRIKHRQLPESKTAQDSHTF